jgi:hypothetical protein
MSTSENIDNSAAATSLITGTTSAPARGGGCPHREGCPHRKNGALEVSGTGKPANRGRDHGNKVHPSAGHESAVAAETDSASPAVSGRGRHGGGRGRHGGGGRGGRGQHPINPVASAEVSAEGVLGARGGGCPHKEGCPHWKDGVLSVSGSGKPQDRTGGHAGGHGGRSHARAATTQDTVVA